MLINFHEQIKAALHEQLKQDVLADHIESIDNFLKQLLVQYPDIDASRLAVKLTELAEKDADERATRVIQYQADVATLIENEIKFLRPSEAQRTLQ